MTNSDDFVLVPRNAVLAHIRTSVPGSLHFTPVYTSILHHVFISPLHPLSISHPLVISHSLVISHPLISALHLIPLSPFSISHPPPLCNKSLTPMPLYGASHSELDTTPSYHNHSQFLTL
ncbi:hypothetical protein BC938DRAFT_474613 [Jimgerdemannia flammicorona]|uniref:Uncharacterized protein n=1 Tax=Jimgerdemannia flammicorona TaxID=994334 RepID=A0A433QSE8_9FUNG|nr:hypothetical protein BC938DRAFT_474613 [Jimgerdemannia flammicorona]